MRLTRVGGLLVVAVAIAACGDDGDTDGEGASGGADDGGGSSDGGGSTDGGSPSVGGGGAGEGGSGGEAPVDCTSIGSCAANDGTSCVDYGGSLDEPMTVEACEEGGSATWSEEPCDTTDTVGGCEYDTAPGGPCATTWYFAPLTAETVMTTCDGQGTYVLP